MLRLLSTRETGTSKPNYGERLRCIRLGHAVGDVWVSEDYGFGGWLS